MEGVAMTNQEAVQIEGVTKHKSGITAKLHVGDERITIHQNPKDKNNIVGYVDKDAYGSGLDFAAIAPEMVQGDELKSRLEGIQNVGLQGSKKDVKIVENILKDMQKTK
jgi:hypothetical protein